MQIPLLNIVAQAFSVPIFSNFAHYLYLYMAVRLDLFSLPATVIRKIKFVFIKKTSKTVISASVDGGPSGGSRVRRPGSEDPHRR